jgi:hypothetical protein
MTQYLRFRPTGQLVDSIAIPEDTLPTGGFVIMGPDGPRPSFFRALEYAPDFRGGVVWARTDAYEYNYDRADGRATKVRRSFTPVRMHPDERRQWEAYLRYTDEQLPNSDLITRLSPEKPPLRDLFTDQDGRVWVDVYAEAQNVPSASPAASARPRITWRERSTFDVFSPSDRYFGRVTLPLGSRVMAVRGERVWVTTTGPDGEQVIVVYRTGIR